VQRLERLAPESIGGLFGRSGSLIERSYLGRLGTRARLLTIGLTSLLAVLLIASGQGVLVRSNGIASAWNLIVRSPKAVGRVSMPLSEDPVALIVLVVALLTPIFCAAQVDAIQDYMPMNEANLDTRIEPVAPGAVDDINGCVARANVRFSRLGTRWVSLLLLALAGLASCLIYALLMTKGLLGSWNSTSITTTVWSERIYEGWWANWHRHLLLAVALWCFGVYLFYFLAKQLIVGVIFASLAHSAWRLKIGIVPNMRTNIDGYWGLRPLRRFMQWTYVSTLSHLLATLGVFVVWLPFTQWTVMLVLAVMLTNAFVVFYPSWLAYDSTVEAKIRYARELDKSNKYPSEEKEKRINLVWETPNLPFHTKGTSTAAAAYFLLPLVLLFFSALLGVK
jgi:hypothetical protein